MVNQLKCLNSKYADAIASLGEKELLSIIAVERMYSIRLKRNE